MASRTPRKTSAAGIIVSYCKPQNKVSLGCVEGLNNTIRVIQRTAYGFRDEQYLAMKIICQNSQNMQKSPTRFRVEPMFADVAKLNEHFKLGHAAEIHDAVIENYDLSGARFENAKFENTEWRKVIARNSLFKNTTFHKCKMEIIELEQSTFENVTFEDCELTDVSFFESKLPVSTFSLAGVNADKYGFEGGTINKVEIRDSCLGIRMREVQIGSLTIERSKIESRFTLSKIDHVDIASCQKVIDLGFYKSTIGTLSVRECALENFRAIGATITTLRVKDSQLRNSEFKNLKADVVTFENVTLDQKIDFTNAQIEAFNVKGLVKSPGLNLITTGSNVKYPPEALHCWDEHR